MQPPLAAAGNLEQVKNLPLPTYGSKPPPPQLIIWGGGTQLIIGSSPVWVQPTETSKNLKGLDYKAQLSANNSSSIGWR